MGRTIVVAALALLLGLFLGGLGPRKEVASLHEQLDEAKAAAARGAASLPFGLAGLAFAQSQQSDPADESPKVEGKMPVPQFRDTQKSGEPTNESEQPPRRRFGLSGDAFSAAKAAADLRAAQFRGAFIEAAALPPAKQQDLEANIATMNQEFAQIADEAAKSFTERGTKLSTRDMVDLGSKVLEVYRRADDKLKGGLDDSGKAALEKTNFDLLSQVDLEGARKLAEAAEKLGTARPGRAEGNAPTGNTP